ncbi:MAG: SDR family oxidoreductase [Gammaproteobacteria bacterium]
MGQFTGRSIIVTGASSGIGEAIARRFAAEGARLTLAARRVDRLQSLAASLGTEVAVRRTDVADAGDMQALAALALERFGAIDVLVNNAGIMLLSPIGAGRVDDWNRMIDVNIKGVLYGIHAVLPHMIARGQGDIVNISSVAGLSASAATSVYSATKSAVKFIGDGLRQETAGKVRVVTIYPGVTRTELMDHVPDPNVKAHLTRLRDDAGLPADAIADAVCYALAQPRGTLVNEIVVRSPSG